MLHFILLRLKHQELQYCNPGLTTIQIGLWSVANNVHVSRRPVFKLERVTFLGFVHVLVKLTYRPVSAAVPSENTNPFPFSQ